MRHVAILKLRRPWPSRRIRFSDGSAYRPALLMVWHKEPHGHHHGEVCSRSWRRWHVHHWRLQFYVRHLWA